MKYPISDSQKSVWISCLIDKTNPSYNIPSLHYIRGSIDVTVFQRAIHCVFDKHSIVYARFSTDKENPYYQIERIDDLGMKIVDLTDKLPEQVYREIQILSKNDAQKAFNIETAPLFRFILYKTGDGEHYFYANFHHLIFDGLSWPVFIRDFNTAYNILSEGKECQFEPHTISHTQLKDSEEKQKHVLFWQEYLKGILQAINFPFDTIRKNPPSGNGKNMSIVFSKELSSRFKQFVKEKELSVLKTLLSIFSVLLHKYSLDRDFCVGLPTTTRRGANVEEDSIGMFVNAIPVRFQFNESTSFNRLLKQTKRNINEVVSHNALPFDEIVEHVKPERSPLYNPIYQISFAWQGAQEFDLGGNRFESKEILVDESNAPFDLTFYMWERKGIIEGRINYNPDLFEDGTIQQLKNNFLQLTDVLIENEDTAIDNLAFSIKTYIDKIDEWNNTTCIYPKDKSLYSLFKESVKKFPDYVAVLTADSRLTYKQLDEAVDALTTTLNELLNSRGGNVGVYLDRSLETVISLLAILKAGGTYVPFNLKDPHARIHKITEQAELSLIIANEKYHDIFQNKIPVYCPVSGKRNECPSFDFFNNRNSSNQHPYIIFTSGTTGIPKGVLVEQPAVINLIDWVNKTFNISEKDRLIWTTNLSFDLSVYDIFGLLSAGGSIRVLSNDELEDPEKQVAIILHEDITFWDSAPQALNRLLPLLNKDRAEAKKSALRLCFASGDWIPLELPPAIFELFPQASFIALGGATEATVWSNYFPVKDINPEWKSIPYGKPIQNCRYYILDEDMNHCRPGIPGDLYIGGVCQASGYYNAPELTAKKFIADPFLRDEKMYFTGDRAQWMGDGNIEFLGRLDEQVKIRGFRVELNEIKQIANKLPGIKEVALVVNKKDRYNQKLYMAYCGKEGKPDESCVKRLLVEKLPDYMIPSKIIRFENLPLTANGKIDTNAILYESLKSSNGKTVNSDLNDSILQEVKRIWEKITKEKVEDVHMNFFDAGGNSLSALHLIVELEKRFSLQLSYRDFAAEYSTINKLSNLLKENRKSTKNSQQNQLLYCVQPEGAGAPVFLVFQDNLLLFEDQYFGKSNPVYNFSSPGSDGEEIPYASVEELAEKCVKELKAVRPHGPYIVGGFSFGGIVAYEIADKLMKQNDEVSLLFMIDTNHPKAEKAPKKSTLDELKEQIQKNGLFPSIIKRISSISFKYRYYSIERFFCLLFKLKPTPGAILVNNLRTYLHLYPKYIPNIYAGKVLLFNAQNTKFVSEQLGWQKTVQNLKTVSVSGAHFDTIKDTENQKLISKVLRSEIDEIEK